MGGSSEGLKKKKRKKKWESCYPSDPSDINIGKTQRQEGNTDTAVQVLAAIRGGGTEPRFPRVPNYVSHSLHAKPSEQTLR